MRKMRHTLLTALTMAVACFLLIPTAAADQVILDDLIVDGSACIGFDCVNGESFGFDTIRIKENNLRIRAQDTSNSASFPTNDWQITFNDSSNGGANKFSIDDIDGGRTPFTIEAGAPSHSLYVDDGGRLGLGTSTPVVDIHIKSGNTPTLRLEQDGSSGFTPQTWDVAGNETNFFIRDATNGSTLPFRIRPGAPTSSIDIDSGGAHHGGTSGTTTELFVEHGTLANVGIHTVTPAFPLHVDTDSAVTSAQIENDSGAFAGLIVAGTAGNFPAGLLRVDSATTGAGVVLLNMLAGGAEVFKVLGDGTVQVNTTTVHPDYVFESDYALMPLDELRTFIEKKKHLPNIPSASEMGNKLNLTEFPIQLLEKVEELTLYVLNQQEKLEGLSKENASLKDRLSGLERASEVEASESGQKAP